MAKLIEEIGQQPLVLQKLCEQYPEGIAGEEITEKEIYLIGTGASLNACYQAKYALIEHYKKNISVIPAFESEYYIPLFGPNTLVILVSQSGESYETRVTCDILCEKNVAFYALTNNPSSYLAQKAKKTFCLEAGVELGTATKTQTSSILLLYLMASKGYKDILKQISDIPNCLLKTIDKAKTYISDFADFIGDAKALYITGIGKQTPTAGQAAIMLKEKVWLNAEGLSLIEFRHGPVEAIEKDTPVIILSFGEENKKIALNHAEFLSKVCGAKVGLVTDYQEQYLNSYPNFSFVWEGNENFSHICAIVPFQLLVEYMANQRGYDIDGFKFIGKVLNNY